MPAEIKDVKKGVIVRITPANSKKVKRLTERTHRTFATEVNVMVEENVDAKIHKYKDDGR